MLRFSWFLEWQVIWDCTLDIVGILLWDSGAYLKILFIFQTSPNTVSMERDASLLPGTGVSPSSPNGLLGHWRVWGVSQYCQIRVEVQDPTWLPWHYPGCEKAPFYCFPTWSPLTLPDGRASLPLYLRQNERSDSQYNLLWQHQGRWQCLRCHLRAWLEYKSRLHQVFMGEDGTGVIVFSVAFGWVRVVTV